MPDADRIKWLIESLRVTVFPTEEIDLSCHWWEASFNRPPDEYIAKAREGFVIEKGDFEEGEIIIRTQRARIDWTYQFKNDVPPTEIPNLGPYPDNAVSFISVVKKWLESAPPIKRIAYGPVLIMPVDSMAQGYEILNSLLPKVDIDQEGCSDFFFQINRPRPTTTDINRLDINRLSKWNVRTLRLGSFAVGAGGITPTAPLTLEEWFVCRLELDINTSPTYEDSIQDKKSLDVLNELIEFAGEITSKGDIP